MKIFISVLFFVFLTQGLFAQFSVKGQFRPRGEVRDGYKLLPDSTKEPALFVSQRTRLILIIIIKKINIRFVFHCKILEYGAMNLYIIQLQ